MIEKIKNFFRNLFKEKSINFIEAPKNDAFQSETIKSNDEKPHNNFNQFQKAIKVDADVQEEKALKLQKDYKAGIIKEEDLSEEDFELLSNLYEKQIQHTKKSIENYRAKILNIQTKLAQNN